MNFKKRLGALERKSPALPAPNGDALKREKRFAFIWKRFARLVTEAEKLMSPEEKTRLSATLRGPGPLIGAWVKDLCLGNCCLPEIAPAVMRVLLLAWLEPDVDVQLRCVCLGCGVEYPFPKMVANYGFGSPAPARLPRYFEHCPHCGAPAKKEGMMWAHRIAEHHHAWMDQDGCVGRPGR